MVTIVDYKAGNILSIKNMLRKIGVTSSISDKPSDILQANKLILPGVGAFDHGVHNLKALELWEPIIEKANANTPILGICLGAQLMGLKSEEGKLSGLGLFDMVNIRFEKIKLDSSLKVPHMGWSNLILKKESVLFEGLNNEARFYFVHAYHFSTNDNSYIDALCHYGYDYPCVLSSENKFAVQFHPEKSHKYGMIVLKNFCNL